MLTKAARGNARLQVEEESAITYRKDATCVTGFCPLWQNLHAWRRSLLLRFRGKNDADGTLHHGLCSEEGTTAEPDIHTE